MNNINYLAITKSPYKISYAIFQGTQLKSYGEYHLSYNNYEKDLYIKLNRIIKGTSTDVIVSHELNFDKYLKKDIVKTKCIFYRSKITRTIKRLCIR